ncbi:MAG: V-type ATP synthase subunit F [Solobacterium sp.]|jgi:V/A-type H+-transporting ATPase subunit F|nr:V-type ATP synthase subunit F [Solobacterium sp.]MCH4223119.1 V-type ATP synthase subunit F [Solobacterium sp.]MCH4266563.1 V-type ATP synthase subunit F [Solobacterium sp.]
MKAYCISDNTDTVMGMRLAGIEGVVLNDREAILKKLDECIQDPDVAVVLMTTKAISMAADVVANYKLELQRPLITEISDRHGSAKIGETIDSYISDAIGIKL